MFPIKLEVENVEEEPYEMKYEFLTVTSSKRELNQSKQDFIPQKASQPSLRRENNKIRQRIKRALETDEQKAYRREQARLRARRSRAEASEEERARRREIAKERKRIERAMETEEQTVKRREMAKQRIRLIRAMESDEEKEKRRVVARERIRLKRALELEEEKIRNREIAKERARRNRAMETDEQRQRRNEIGRERMRRKRTLELLRSCGYGDQQLKVFNHFMQSFGHMYDFSKRKLDFSKISEFFTEGEKRFNQDFEPNFSEHSFLKIEKMEDENLERIASQPGQSQETQHQSSSFSEPLDHRIIPPFIGKRITDIKYLFEELQKISLHNLRNRCNFSYIRLVSEVANGLESIITLQCKNCDAIFKIHLNNWNDQSNLNVNVSATEAVGIGFTGLRTLCETIGLLGGKEEKYEETHGQMDNILIKEEVFIKEERDADEDN